MSMDILKKIFGKNSTYLKVILLFYNNNSYFNNITGLANTLDVSHITARKVISDLIDAEILKKIDIGHSKVIKANEGSPYAKALFDFLDSVRGIEDKELIEVANSQQSSWD